MTRSWTGRALLVLGLALAVLLASPGTASAAFSARVVASTTVGTATVAPPTAATTAGSTNCGALTTNYTVRITWTASVTPRVVSYRVVETVNGTPRAAATIAGTTASRNASKALLSTANHSFSVVAVTDYGWTSPVAATASYTC